MRFRFCVKYIFSKRRSHLLCFGLIWAFFAVLNLFCMLSQFIINYPPSPFLVKFVLFSFPALFLIDLMIAVMLEELGKFANCVHHNVEQNLYLFSHVYFYLICARATLYKL